MSVFRSLLMSIKNEEGRLPSEYQEVEYIQSSGSQFINTNITSSTEVQVNFDFEFVSLNNQYNRIFGTTQVNYSQYGIRSSSSNGGVLHGELPNYPNNERDINVNILINQRYKIKFNENKNFIVDDIVYAILKNTYRMGSQMIYLFKQNPTGGGDTSASGASIKLYSSQLYNNNVLVRDYVPCYRKSDNVIGLYDLVNNEFYTNAGTGTFLKGSDV